jgi:hypothetical protein
MNDAPGIDFSRGTWENRCRGLSPGPLWRGTDGSGVSSRDQPAFSAISRPWMKQLELTGTSSVGENANRPCIRGWAPHD